VWLRLVTLTLSDWVTATCKWPSSMIMTMSHWVAAWAIEWVSQPLFVWTGPNDSEWVTAWVSDSESASVTGVGASYWLTQSVILTNSTASVSHYTHHSVTNSLSDHSTDGNVTIVYSLGNYSPCDCECIGLGVVWLPDREYDSEWVARTHTTVTLIGPVQWLTPSLTQPLTVRMMVSQLLTEWVRVGD